MQLQGICDNARDMSDDHRSTFVAHATGAVQGALTACPDTPTMLPALSCLALSAAALAIPFPFNLLSRNSQTPLLPSNFKVSSPKLEIGWADPRVLGGQFIDVSILSVAPTSLDPSLAQFTTPRYGEPLNVIISNQSDPFVLTDEGFRWYYK